MAINPLQIPGYAAPTPIDFSSLAKLPEVYQKARDEANTRMTLANLGQGIQDGNVDYTKAAGQALSSGNATLGMSLLQLGEQQKKQKLELEASKNFSNQVGGMFGQPATQSPASPGGYVRPQSGGMPGLDEGIDAASKKYGIDPNYLRTTAQVESNYGKNNSTPLSSAGGPFAFIDGTAKQYGLTNKNDPAASADAAARLAVDNKAALTQALGREPTNGELYLAHQQGAGGAIKLLTNPNAPAVQVIGQQALINNGGSPAMTSAQFAQGFTRKFDNQPQQADNSALPPNARPATQVASLGNLGMPSGPSTGSPSPLDTAPWPAGPVNSPGPIVSGDGPSPLDAAQWPAGPVGAPGSNNTQVAQAPQPAPQQAPAAAPTPARVLPPALMQDPTTARIGQLLAASVNPNLPAAQKEVAKTLLTHALKASELTSDQKEYIGAVAQGEQATFTDWMRGNKKAGATAITIDQKGESKFEEEFGKKQADRWIGYMTNADAARKKMVDVNTMREISGRLGSQGAAAGVKEAIGPYAEALGVNIEGLSDIQAYTQVIQRLAPQQRAPGSGSTSDIEFKGFVKSLPGLSQNPAAREMGLNTMEALSRDDMARGEIASKLATGQIKRSQAEYELRALPDPMKGFVEWRKANPELYGQSLKGGASAPPNTNNAPQQNQQRPTANAPQQAPDGKFYIPDPARPGKYLQVVQ